MKNFIPSMTIILIVLIVTIVFSLLSVHVFDLTSFLVFVGKIVGLWSACYCLGYGGTCAIVTMIDKIKDRHKKRFMWYYKMGLLESAVLTEPKYAKKLCRTGMD